MFKVPNIILAIHHRYNVKRATQDLDVAYYVKETFTNDFQGNIKRLESGIEEEYVSITRNDCFKQRNYKVPIPPSPLVTTVLTPSFLCFRRIIWYGVLGTLGMMKCYDKPKTWHSRLVMQYTNLDKSHVTVVVVKIV